MRGSNSSGISFLQTTTSGVVDVTEEELEQLACNKFNGQEVSYRRQANL
jgi:hypothetical protein